MWRLAIAPVAGSGYRAGTLCRPPMRWMRRGCNRGPEALILAVHLNKRLGISYGNAAAVLRIGYGLEVSRAGAVPGDCPYG
jgi:hypothetical protein